MPKEIEPRDVAERMRHGAVLLDVRDPDEWTESHVRGAIHIPLGELQGRIAEVPTGLELICMCRSGRRSEKACAIVGEVRPSAQAINMTGGILRWVEQGLPVES